MIIWHRHSIRIPSRHSKAVEIMDTIDFEGSVEFGQEELADILDNFPLDK